MHITNFLVLVINYTIRCVCLLIFFVNLTKDYYVILEEFIHIILSQNSISLKVLEAYTRDVGRGIARIDYDTMDSLAVSTGDVVEIRGKRRTTAKCLPLYPSDEGKGIIRIDGLVRNNSGIAIGDTIFIRKIKAVPAEKAVVAPLEAIPPIDERYLADALESVPIIKGDNVMVPYFGGRLRA